MICNSSKLRADLQMGASADDSCGAGFEKFAFQASRIGPTQLWNFLLVVKYLVGSWEKDWTSSRIQADAPGSSIDHLDNWAGLLAHAPCIINTIYKFTAIITEYYSARKTDTDPDPV
jgi:hypothetical protein